MIKIMILLTLLIYMIGFIQSYFPPDRTKKIIGRYKGIVGRGTFFYDGGYNPFFAFGYYVKKGSQNEVVGDFYRNLCCGHCRGGICGQRNIINFWRIYRSRMWLF